MARIVYVNGAYLPEDQGTVSMFDRGFLFATEIDGHRIGGGQSGPVARKLRELILEEAMR